VDINGDGDISFDEFVTMMQMGEVETDFTKEINEAFKFFDKDGDGEVSKGRLPFVTRTSPVCVGAISYPDLSTTPSRIHWRRQFPETLFG